VFVKLWECISGSRQSNVAVDGRKHCLLMDEVDGMAGNEDRGGLQVLNFYVFFVFDLILQCRDSAYNIIKKLDISH